MKRIFKKYSSGTGFTLIEVLIALAILTIIIVVVVINIRPSSKLEQLKTATDHLVDDLKYLQTLATSNIKIKEVEDKVERGYSFVFIESQRNYYWYEILADSATQTENFDFYHLETKSFYYPEIKLINIEYSATPLGFLKENQIKFITPVYVAAPFIETIMQTDFFFPDAEMRIVQGYGKRLDNACSGQPCIYMILYLKHDEVDFWQSKITIDKLSGKITGEIIAYP